MQKQVTACWQADDKSLVVSCPSSRGGGNYLVGVTQKNGTILIAHSCPASQKGLRCWHIDKALHAFKEWRWWDSDVKNANIKSVAKKIQLDQNWKQIPIPGIEIDDLLEVI